MLYVEEYLTPVCYYGKTHFTRASSHAKSSCNLSKSVRMSPCPPPCPGHTSRLS